MMGDNEGLFISEEFHKDETPAPEPKITPTIVRVRVLGSAHTHRGTTYLHGSVIELPLRAASYVLDQGLAIVTSEALNPIYEQKRGR